MDRFIRGYKRLSTRENQPFFYIDSLDNDLFNFSFLSLSLIGSTVDPGLPGTHSGFLGEACYGSPMLFNK